MQGTLDELKSRVLGHPEYEVQFAQPWEADNFTLPEGVELLSRTASSFRLRVSNPLQANPVLLKKLTVLAPVLSMQPEPRSLEQVYLKVMAEARGQSHVQ